MNRLLIGRTKTDKISKLREIINTAIENGQRVLILNYNNLYSDFDELTLPINDLNHTLSKLTYRDMKALNAGYLTDKSRKLLSSSEDVLRDSEAFRNGQSLESIEIDGLVEEAHKRLLWSYKRMDNQYGELLDDYLPSAQPKKRDFSVEHAVNQIISSPCTTLTMKSTIPANQLRANTFLLLSRLSHQSTKPTLIIADNLTNFFKGNIPLFFESTNLKQLHFAASFNSINNCPPPLFNIIDEFFIFSFKNKSDIKDLETLGFHFPKPLQQLKLNEYVTCANPQHVTQGGSTF